MGTQSESREKPAIKARYENLTGDDLRGRIAAMGISQRAFAAKVGLSEGGLRYLIARRGNLVSHRVETLLRAVELEVAIGAILAATKPRAQIPKRALQAVYHVRAAAPGAGKAGEDQARESAEAAESGEEEALSSPEL
jgi:transcriptional regulator with XRE-family HTH domain